MQRHYLTSKEQTFLDPTGKGYQHITRMKRDRYYAPLPVNIDAIDITDWFTKTAKANGLARSHSLYFHYSTEMLSKCGRQGGGFPFSVLESLVAQYYDEASKPVYIDDFLRLGRDYLLQVVKERLERNGPPCYVNPKFYMTNSGLRTFTKKGSYQAETHARKYFIHPYCNLPGQRVMRGKDRVIYMDDVANVRAIEETLSSVREWLRTNIPEFFGAWLNPWVYVNPTLTHMVDKHAYFVESDYKGMDMHFSRTIVIELILPLYELLSPDTYLSFASFVEELFEQPVYMGDYILTGLHALFSGQAITNDFETIYTVMLYIGKLVYYGVLENARLCAIGDDATLALIRCTDRFPRYLLDSIIDSSNQANMIIHDFESGKSAIRKGETVFCRKIYAPRGRRKDNILIGAYPSPLVLNNIIQPERPSPTVAQQAVAILQRLDVAEGSPDYSPLVQAVVRKARLDLLHVDSSAIEKETEKDWWFRVYGEKWDPTVSPSYALIQQTYQVRRLFDEAFSK